MIGPASALIIAGIVVGIVAFVVGLLMRRFRKQDEQMYTCPLDHEPLMKELKEKGITGRCPECDAPLYFAPRTVTGHVLASPELQWPYRKTYPSPRTESSRVKPFLTDADSSEIEKRIVDHYSGSESSFNLMTFTDPSPSPSIDTSSFTDSSPSTDTSSTSSFDDGFKGGESGGGGASGDW